MILVLIIRVVNSIHHANLWYYENGLILIQTIHNLMHTVVVGLIVELVGSTFKVS